MKQFLLCIVTTAWSTIAAYSQSTLSTQEKIYGLSKFWQEANYNFVFIDKIDQEAWNKTFVKYIDEVQKTTSDYEYYRLLQKFCAQLNDGHTNVYLPSRYKQMRTYFGDYRIAIENIEGKAIITHVNVSKKKEIPIGSEIVSVNGLSTKTYIEKHVKPYISSSTQYVMEDMSVRNLLLGLDGETYELIYKTPKEKLKKITLTHKASAKEPMYPEVTPFEPLKVTTRKDIAIVEVNTFENDEVIELFKKHLDKLKKAKGIVIDLRNNPGGRSDVSAKFLSYFTKDSLITGAKSYSRKHIPTYYAWGKFMEPQDTIGAQWQRDAYNSYRGKLMHTLPYETLDNTNTIHFIKPTAVLIGHDTASAAEDFLVMARNQKHFTVIGNPTNGSTGQPYFFDLPGGAQARICTKKDVYPDGTEFVGFGIQPDVFVPLTYSDFIKGRDAVLEKALQHLLTKQK